MTLAVIMCAGMMDGGAMDTGTIDAGTKGMMDIGTVDAGTIVSTSTPKELGSLKTMMNIQK